MTDCLARAMLKGLLIKKLHSAFGYQLLLKIQFSSITKHVYSYPNSWLSYNVVQQLCYSHWSCPLSAIHLSSDICEFLYEISDCTIQVLGPFQSTPLTPGCECDLLFTSIDSEELPSISYSQTVRGNGNTVYRLDPTISHNRLYSVDVAIEVFNDTHELPNQNISKFMFYVLLYSEYYSFHLFHFLMFHSHTRYSECQCQPVQ